MNFSEKEKNFLLKFEKTVEKIYLYYIAISLSFINTIFGLIFGITLKNRKGFSIAMFFGIIGLSLLVISNVYKKLYKIIFKMRHYIIQLEKKLGDYE